MLKISSHDFQANFYRFASVTFAIKDSHKIAQPQDLSMLSYEIHSWAAKNVPQHLRMQGEWIAPDGLYIEQPIGVLNWYVPKNVPIDSVKEFIHRAIEDVLKPIGVATDRIWPSVSRLYDANVWRIEIVSNATYDRESFPYLNVTNRNADILLNLLDLSSFSETFEGSIDALSLKEYIDNARDKVAAFTLPTVQGDNKRDIEFGVSEDQLSRYLDALDRLCSRALAGDIPNPTIVWN